MFANFTIMDSEQIFQWLQTADADRDKDRLQHLVAELIDKDFERLVWLLYRVDVDEATLRFDLQKSPAADAAAIITERILERLRQKKASREKYHTDPNASDEEKW
ncbi:MAG: hypothetical protein ACO1OO_15280 [Flavisolibacter sp.]